MQMIRVMIIILLASWFIGCGPIRHDYTWKEYPITEERVLSQNYKENGTLHIIKGQSDKAVYMMGKIGPHEYYGSLQSLSDGIAEQLYEMMEIKGLTLDEKAEKALTIRVNRTDFEQGMWKVAATIDFEVEFGDGRIKKYSVRNSSPTTVEYTFNGAVALAVIKILNDPQVASYINQS